MSARTNQQWLDALRASGPLRERAVADLRSIIFAGLSKSLRSWKRGSSREFQTLVDDFSQEAIMRILDKLDQFADRSRFTTWAQKIAVRVALTELRRSRWRDVSLDVSAGDDLDRAPAGRYPGPETSAVKRDLLIWVQRVMTEELTHRQRLAMKAIAIDGMPLEEVAARLGTNRNALYKLIHDARVRLRNRFRREETSAEEILEVMDTW